MVGVFLLPKVKVQTELFMSQFPSYLERVDKEILELSSSYPLLAEILPELVVEAPDSNKEVVESNDQEYSPSRSMLQELLKVGGESDGIENVNHILGTLGNIGGKIAAVTSTFLLSILFSFLILLDLPRLAASVRELENTKFRFIYLSVVDDIRDFSQVLGQSSRGSVDHRHSQQHLDRHRHNNARDWRTCGLSFSDRFFLQLHSGHRCFYQLCAYLSDRSPDLWN